ncbi:MAG: hypothetical protein PHX04_03180 [Bacilli bacterium]|nr:hypothetical protein [Bacilli bacterium]
MTIIDSSTVVVFNHDELEEVLSEINTYTLVYLGADITLESGIKILSSKSEVTIDGTYLEERYTLTIPYGTWEDTIYVEGLASSINLTVQNVDIDAENIHGAIFIENEAIFRFVLVNFINITFTGPTVTWCHYSSVFIINSDITIPHGDGVVNGDAVAISRNVTFGGNVNITSDSPQSLLEVNYDTFSAIPLIEVLPNSNIDITHPEGAFYEVSFTTICNITFGSNSISNIKNKYGMSYTGSDITQNLIIDSGALVNIEQSTRQTDRSTWYINGQFKMNDGSSLRIICDFDGIADNYCLRFLGGASVDINNPKSVVLYNKTTDAIKSNSNTPYNLNISQYNRWGAVTPFASAGNIYDIPTYSWYKLEDVSNLVLNGTITSTGTIITTINLTPDEIIALPDLNELEFNNTSVLSMGRPSLTINPITDSSTEITGKTTPDADVRISYLGDEHYEVADSNGDYIYSYSPPLAIGTEISFVSNLAYSFLYRFRTVEIVFEGDLFIKSATSQVTFYTTPFQSTPTLCMRSTPLSVVVEEGRITPDFWNLYATITHALINEHGDILTNGLVFVDSIGAMTPLSGTPVLVYTSDGIATGDITVDWPDEEGILLQLNIVPIVKDTTYKTDINWMLG